MEVVLTTPRLVLRRAILTDIEPLSGIWSDFDVMKYMGGPRDPEKVKDHIQEAVREGLSKPMDLWTTVLRSSSEVVGDCGFVEKMIEGRNEVEVVYIISKSQWGNGFATEVAEGLLHYAWDQLQLKRVVALIDPQNASSERVALKIGMKFEREVVRPKGRRMKLYSSNPPSIAGE